VTGKREALRDSRFEKPSEGESTVKDGRWLLATVVWLAVALVAAAPAAWGQTPKIVQWDWFDKSTKEGGPWWTYVEEQLKEWGVEFEMGIGWDEAKVPIAISSGVVIDGIQIPFHQAANWTELGLLYPITDFIERDPTLSIEDFLPGSFDPVTKDGEIYALPWIMDFELILVNVDLFREMGIDPSVTDDWDWDTFLEIAKKLTRFEPDGTVSRTGFAAWMNRWTWNTFLFANGGRFFNEDETAAAFNSPQGMEALEFLIEMHLQHQVMQPGFEGEQAFINGLSGMTLSGPWVEAFHEFPM